MHTGSDPVCTPWASQAIERNGKWYWYVAAEDTTKHLHGIGVAVADRPEGPWADPIGRPHPQDRHLRTSREEMTFGTI